MARALAQHIELAFEGVLIGRLRSARDEHLPDHRFDFLGALGQAAVVGRHVAPTQQDLPFGEDRPFDLLFARHSRCGLARQEDHAHAVVTSGRKRDAKLAAGAAQEGIGQLDEDAGAVALQRVGARGATVRQVFQYREGALDNGMIFPALDMGDETKAAGVMFVAWIVETLCPWRPMR
jgi:hypothetical protein